MSTNPAALNNGICFQQLQSIKITDEKILQLKTQFVWHSVISKNLLTKACMLAHESCKMALDQSGTM